MANPIVVFKAQPVSDEPVPDLRIEATEDMPSSYSLPNDTTPRIVFEEQAELVVDAMLRSLPGGTIDAILVRLLDHKRSIYVVVYPKAGG